MQTRSRVTTLLIVALSGSLVAVMATGQDNSAKSRQLTQPALSVTRSASCLVRITVDPAIVLLDPATVQGLLHSSGVAGKAAREVLHLGSMETPSEEFIEMEWLNESSTRRSTTTASTNDNAGPYDEQMLRELEKIYGTEYVRQSGMISSKSARKPDQPPSGNVDSVGPYGGRPKRTPPAPPSPSVISAGQSTTIKLSVRLPDSVPPAADEFLTAIVENLRDTLRQAYGRYTNELEDMVAQVQRQYEYLADPARLEGETDAATRIKEQLKTVVDLSAWNPEMPMAEAIEILKKSVEPPLNIVVLWNDLTDSLHVQPTTPIHIDAMRNVSLGTAIDLLVKGMSSEVKPVWKIKDDTIVIATAPTLAGSGPSPGQPKVELDTRALAAQQSDLTGKLQELELSMAGQEARRKAISEQIRQTQAQAQERLMKDEVMRELESLVELSSEALSNVRKAADAGRASLTNDVAEATQKLAMARIELAKRKEELSKQVGGGQLEQFNAELSRIAIDAIEKEAQRQILSQQLYRVQQQLAQSSAFDPDAARARVQRETLNILAGRIAELQTRIANLQPPMVMVIGAN